METVWDSAVVSTERQYKLVRRTMYVVCHITWSLMTLGDLGADFSYCEPLNSQCRKNTACISKDRYQNTEKWCYLYQITVSFHSQHYIFMFTSLLIDKQVLISQAVRDRAVVFTQCFLRTFYVLYLVSNDLGRPWRSIQLLEPFWIQCHGVCGVTSGESNVMECVEWLVVNPMSWSVWSD